MTDLLKVTIDGHELAVPKGTTILDAAASVGVEVPTFCYHPGLSAPANCRMCLVNTNKSNKLLPACYATVMDGMEVTTQDEKTLRTRKSTLEFILLHHPVDCPICDQAGECVLQDNYFAHSASPSRLFTRKGHKPKATQIGPNIVLDAERCIVCTRCVRFCDEVTRTGELRVWHRGERSFVTTFPGKQLDNDYATCAADICPVGALTSKDFRFKMRVWFLKTADSVCGGCSRGCNIHVDHGDGEVQRYRPRENADVNQWWMCDPGRLSYKALQADRIARGRVGTEEHPLRSVVARAARTLADFGRDEGFERLAVVPCLMSTNEDFYALTMLLETVGADGVRFYEGGRADGKEDEILQKADKNANRQGLRTRLEARGISAEPLAMLQDGIAKGVVRGVVWMGHEHAVSDELAAAVQGLSMRIAFASNDAPVLAGADVVLPICTYEEVDGTWTNFEGRVQELAAGPSARGDATPLWSLCYQLVRHMGHMDVRPPNTAAALRAALTANIPAMAEA